MHPDPIIGNWFFFFTIDCYRLLLMNKSSKQLQSQEIFFPPIRSHSEPISLLPHPPCCWCNCTKNMGGGDVEMLQRGKRNWVSIDLCQPCNWCKSEEKERTGRLEKGWGKPEFCCMLLLPDRSLPAIAPVPLPSSPYLAHSYRLTWSGRWAGSFEGWWRFLSVPAAFRKTLIPVSHLKRSGSSVMNGEGRA